MPVFYTPRKHAGHGARERDEEGVPAGPPLPLPVAAEPAAAGLGSCLRRNDESVGPGRPLVGPGRPYRVFVEGEARKYWEAMVKVGKLKKPGQGELRAAAMPVLGKALRRRRGQTPDSEIARYRARQAVNVMQNYAIARDWVMPPYTLLSKYAAHEDALLQLADDAGWLYREIPLPEHPDPQHPPIHYTIDPVSKLPVPTEDSLIRADYVYDPLDGSRVTQADLIPPWRTPANEPAMHDLTARGWDACYTFHTSRYSSWDRPWDSQVELFYLVYYWISPANLPNFKIRCDRLTHPKYADILIKGMHFSPCPPTPEQVISYRRKVDLVFGIDS